MSNCLLEGRQSLFVPSVVQCLPYLFTALAAIHGDHFTGPGQCLGVVAVFNTIGCLGVLTEVQILTYGSVPWPCAASQA